MPLLAIRIACFCLIPIGIFLLIRAIQIIRKAFFGAVLIDLPYSAKSADFTIQEAGNYAIWQKGRLFKRTPVNQFRPQITNSLTHETVALSPAILGTSSSNGYEARTILFSFRANPGAYRLDLVEGSSVGGVQRVLANLLTGPGYPPLDLTHYSVQVRQSVPFYLSFISVPLILLAAFCIIGGLISGILADQIFG